MLCAGGGTALISSLGLGHTVPEATSQLAGNMWFSQPSQSGLWIVGAGGTFCCMDRWQRTTYLVHHSRAHAPLKTFVLRLDPLPGASLQSFSSSPPHAFRLFLSTLSISYTA